MALKLYSIDWYLTAEKDGKKYTIQESKGFEVAENHEEAREKFEPGCRDLERFHKQLSQYKDCDITCHVVGLEEVTITGYRIIIEKVEK